MRPMKPKSQHNVTENPNQEFILSVSDTSSRPKLQDVRGFNIQTIVLTGMLGLFASGCANKVASNSGPIPEGTSLSTLSHDGETREFIVHVPSSYTGTEALPVLLNFHGFGGTAIDFMNWTDMRDLADRENFILVYPQGSLLEGQPHWNSALPSADNKSTTDDFGFVEAMLDDLSANHRVDRDRVYASGYSNGSFFSYALACYRSDLVAAVASVSGTMMEGLIEDCEPSHPTAMINIHGTSDYVVPYHGGPGYSSVEDVLDYWIDFNGTTQAPITSESNNVERYAYSSGDGNTAVEHYRVNDGGHIWFEMEYDGASTGELIWNFVSQYNRSGRIELD